MSLFDEMLKNEDYRRMFDQLSDEERGILMDSLRKLVEDVEKAIITPVENLKAK